jgi:hypothetical protein
MVASACSKDYLCSGLGYGYGRGFANAGPRAGNDGNSAL